MGRAIVRQPQVFCMDEPLSNLDAKLRVSTRTQIVSLQARLGITTVYVTHDQVEAMTMGDRVAVMNAGILQQVDTPMALYKRPANVFVAGFMGSPAMNLLSAEVHADGVHLGDAVVPISPQTRSRVNGEITVGMRPEDWVVLGDGEKGLAMDVTLTEELGSDAYMYGTVMDRGEPKEVVVKLERDMRFDKGDVVQLTGDPARMHIFDTARGDRISF
jgi:multiple sugar transport system ATP-binding protein